MKNKSVVVALLVISCMIGIIQFEYSFVGEAEFQKEPLSFDADEIQSLLQNTILSAFYENLGQIENTDVKYYCNFNAHWIGFGISKIIMFDSKGYHSSTFFGPGRKDEITRCCMSGI